MPVIFHHEDWLIWAYLIELGTGKKAPLLDRIWRSAEGNENFCRTRSREIRDHFLNMLIRTRMHDIQTSIERGKRRQMLMSVNESRAQGAALQPFDRRALELRRQGVSNIRNYPRIFNQIASHAIARIDRENCSLVDFHRSLPRQKRRKHRLIMHAIPHRMPLTRFRPFTWPLLDKGLRRPWYSALQPCTKYKATHPQDCP